MHDQRLVTRLQNYWELIRRGKPMPEIAHFNPAAIEDLWPQCMKLETFPAQGQPQFTYRYMGAKLITLFGKDLTGQTIDRNESRYPFSMIVLKLEEAYFLGKGCEDESQFVNEKSKLIKYRACFLPFGNETKGITHFIVGLSDRSF